MTRPPCSRCGEPSDFILGDGSGSAYCEACAYRTVDDVMAGRAEEAWEGELTALVEELRRRDAARGE